MRTLPPSVPLFASVLFVAGCSSGGSSGNELLALEQNLNDQNLNTLAVALQATGLDRALLDGGRFTLFAPTEQAFAQLPPGVLDDLLLPQNQDLLSDILLYHAVDGTVDAATVLGLDEATTKGGAEVLVDVVGGDLFVNEARVETTDIAVRGGLVHVIDTVLTPPQDLVATLQARGFQTLVTAVQAADLVDDLSGPGPLTVLAPTDAAFALLPAGVLADLLQPANQAALVELLTYHVVPGAVAAGDALDLELAGTLAGPHALFALEADAARVNGVRLELVNVPATNGVVHVLDAVLEVPSDVPTLAGELGFNTLGAALQAAGLDDDLAAPGPFTVFAPTDAAFAALPAGVLDDLLLPANQQLLIDVLLYHVVGEKLTATDVLGGGPRTTLLGDDVTPALDAGVPRINGAEIVATDVLGANGIVHAIDAVLLPPGFVAPAPADGGGFVTGLRSQSEVPPTRDGATFDLLDVMEDNGPEFLPAWFGSARTAVAWQAPLTNASPQRPDVLGSRGEVQLVAQVAGSAAVRAALERAEALRSRLRILVNELEGTSQAVLQVRAEERALTVVLRLEDALGNVRSFAPERIVRGTDEVAYRWSEAQLADGAAGLDDRSAARRLEVVLDVEAGAVVEALRFGLSR